MRLGARLLFGFALLCLWAPADAQARHRKKPPKHHAGSKSQLNNQLRAIHERKVKLRRELNKTTHQAHAVLEDIHVVDDRLHRLEDELQETTDRLGDSRAEQKALAVHLAQATTRLHEVKDQVRRRLREMYMSGQGSFLSALAGTRTVDDLVSEKTLLEAIARKDRDMFDEYSKLRHDIGVKKHRADELVVEIRGLRVREAGQHVVLKQTRAEKGEILGALKQKQGELQREIAQFDADEADIVNEIRAFDRRGHTPLPAFVGRFLKPAQGRITSGFGMRYHPILHYTRMHKGIDFGAPYGSPIVAAADGEVIAAHYSSSFGNMIIIAHGGNLSTVYAHCSRLFVHAGQRVRRGERIGLVGNTGLAQGPHLHWEVHVGGTAVNPMGRF